MKIEETIKRNNILMQNMVDKMETISKKDKPEENPQKGNGHVLEGIKQQLDEHYQNVSDGITLIVKTNRAAVTSPEFKNMDLTLGAILKSLNNSKEDLILFISVILVEFLASAEYHCRLKKAIVQRIESIVIETINSTRVKALL